MDVAVCVPIRGWETWLSEGDLAGEFPSNREYAFRISPRTCPKGVRFPGQRPSGCISPGERVYVFCNGVLRGYSLLVRIERYAGACLLIRSGPAVACTIDRRITPFKSIRYRFWDRSEEKPFPSWTKL